MNTYINNLIENLDDYLKTFADKYLDEIKEYNESSGNNAYFCYERMLSIVANNYLAEQFYSSDNVNLLLYVSEFPIKMKNKPKKKIEVLKKDVDYRKKVKEWDNCFIDGYFKLEINNENKHLFVEYKLQNVFKYADLAADYLKYKLYTYNCDIDTMFCYVVFKKEEKYPSIIENGSDNKYCLLDNVIYSTDIYDSRVYIYKGENKIIPDEDYILLPTLVKTMDKFSKFGTELVKLQEQDIEEIDDKGELLLQLLPKFNSRVIKSRLINNNYNFIVDLWDKANQKGMFDVFNNLINSGNESAIYELLYKGSTFNAIIDEDINKEDRILAEQNGIRGSAYTSLNLLALLDYFGDRYGINSIKPDYGVKYIGRKKNKSLFNYQTTANNRKNKLNEHYGYKSTNDLVMISFSLLYFIMNLYEILYEIDPVENKIIEEKNISKLIKLEEDIQDIYDSVSKMVNCKVKIRIKELMDDEALKELFYQIYNKYK